MRGGERRYESGGTIYLSLRRTIDERDSMYVMTHGQLQVPMIFIDIKFREPKMLLFIPKPPSCKHSSSTAMYRL